MRRHTPRWINRLASTIQEHRKVEAELNHRLRLAELLWALPIGTSAGFSGDEQLQHSIQDTIRELLNPDEGNEDYFFDPEAQPDWKTIRQVATPVKVSA